PAVTPRTQEDRDAICAYEAHSQAGPASTARLERRERRGAAHRNRAEPEAARQVHLPSATIGGGGLSGVGASGVGVNRRYRRLLIGARNKGQSKTYAKAPSVNASKFCNTFGGKADNGLSGASCRLLTLGA